MGQHSSNFNDQFNAYGLTIFPKRRSSFVSASFEQKEGSRGGITNNWILGHRKILIMLHSDSPLELIIMTKIKHMSFGAQ